MQWIKCAATAALVLASCSWSGDASAVMMASKGCVDTTIGGVTYESCTWDTYDDGGGGGGGGAHETGGGSGGGGGGGSFPSVSAPDSPTNPVKATCKSDTLAREDHAQQDAKYYNVMHPGSPLRAGYIVKVTYDDGGVEYWIASGMSAPLHPPRIMV